MPMTNIQSDMDFHNVFIFRRNEILVNKNTSFDLPNMSIYNKCMEYQLATDWFCEQEHQYTAVQLEHNAPEPTGCDWVPIRTLIGLQHDQATLICRAAALLNWRAKTRFCSKCGSQLHNSTDETARICLSCGTVFYPSLSPAMIVLVKKGEQILLARHRHRNTDVFTCLAGYVEAGESVEQCVEREVKEESGITVTNICYQESQSWPFPDQLMLAFTAEWKDGELTPQASEINELKWFNYDNLPPIPGKGSVAYKLIMKELNRKIKN